MLPGYEGKRYYVNALTGSPAGRFHLESTSFSVHDSFYGGRCVGAFYTPARVRREGALALCDELNAEHDAWMAACEA
jgi:hypothetical protein